MKLFVFIMLSLFFIGGCAAQTRLPSEMPEKITVEFNRTGGMSRSYTKAKIEDGVLEFEESNGNRRNARKWSAEVSRADLAELYKIFVENKFDTIENDERKTVVYDAGSENISVSVDKLKSFGVTYGMNSPLSGKNLDRYQKIKRAIDDLIAKYRIKRATDSSEAEDFIQGTWRVAGGDGVRAWLMEWTFADGTFRQTGYPPIVQEGKYRVVRADAAQLTLELFDQKGTFGTKNSELQILLDKPREQLTISGMKGFLRIAPPEAN